MQKIQETELELKCQTSDLFQKNLECENIINSLTEEKNKLKDQLQDTKQKLEKSSQETDAKMKKKITLLEKDLEHQKKQANDELQSVNQRSEASYSQLKEFYEAEKKRLETRLQDEKERAEKKYNLMIEEFEERIRTENENFEEEILNRDEEIQSIENYYNEEINNYKRQSGLDLQKIETLEKYLKDTKEQLEASQKSQALALEQLQERFNAERTSLLEKIEKVVNELSLKEREYSSVLYKKQQIESLLLHKDSELEDLKTLYEKDKLFLSEKIDSTKQQFIQLSDEYVQKKNDFKREMALAQQESEFKNRKISDLEKALMDSEEKYNEAIKSLRDESGQELSATIKKLTFDKENLEQKLEQKKKNLKETTLANTKQVATLEKEKAVLSEKLGNLEAKFADLNERYKIDLENLNLKLKEKKDNESDDKMSVFIENERLKTLLTEMEKEMAERTSAIERERLLWENKHNFLIQQRDSAKSDLSEAHKKFDVTLEQIQKKSVFDKEKLEANTNTLINSIESRYTNQIKDMQENYQGQITNLNNKIKYLEKELRAVKEEFELEKRGKNANSGNTEKKLQEMQENESRLFLEIENCNKEKEKRLEELQESFNKEKSQISIRISELEKRAINAENLKNNIFVEFERERVK